MGMGAGVRIGTARGGGGRKVWVARWVKKGAPLLSMIYWAPTCNKAIEVIHIPTYLPTYSASCGTAFMIRYLVPTDVIGHHYLTLRGNY